MNWDVIVIGAGAAGLIAAIRAAEEGRRTLVLEKNRKPGVKILMSGGTRCNLTHGCDRRGITEAFGDQGKFLYSPLAAFGPQDLIDLVEAEGVATKVESTGKVFPVSNKATDILAAFLRRLERSGTHLALGEPLLEMNRAEDGWTLQTPKQSLLCKQLILTTGGQSYPGCGTTGDGYRFGAKLGHTIVSPKPALVPLKINHRGMNELSGITLPDVEVRIEENGNELVRKRGSFLFTHFGCSGPVILDVSREVSGHPDPSSLRLVCNWLPDLSAQQLDDQLRQASATAGKKQLAVVPGEWLPQRVATMLLSEAGFTPDRKAAALSKTERYQLLHTLTNSSYPITGTLGFAKAEVTAGGIALDEIDSRIMQSKIVPGLFVAGEVLDLDGPIGGYNFQAAFSTGWLAGALGQR